MNFDWIICCGKETEGESEAMATTERSVADKQALVENSVNDSTAPAQVEYVENSVNDSTAPGELENCVSILQWDTACR